MEINSGDTTLVIISAALVCLMTPGLAFFYGGLVRKKNVLTIMMQSYISMGIVTLIWFVFGFSLAFGQDVGGVIGNLDHLFLAGVTGDPNPVYGSTIPFLVFFVFQEMFAIITPALITGAFADRVDFKSYLAFLSLWSIFVYIPICHWIWGGGFLAALGMYDFAGGIVVHTSAGMSALAAVIFVGKRKLMSKDSLQPHNIAFVALGTALLWFGWFGFNGGSALAANGTAAIAFVNTDIAASTAMLTWLALSWIKEGKPGTVGAMLGAVAGLVVITPLAGFIPIWAAALSGILGATASYGAYLVRSKLGWDDALDVWAVHGVGGILGTILVGVFSTSTIGAASGILDGSLNQLYIQLTGTAVCAAYAFAATMGILKAVNLFAPFRVPAMVEQEGLDEIIHGETAYNY